MSQTKKTVRLPAHVRPQRYRIVLKPDLKKFEFSGEETIYAILDKPSKVITLHAKELRVSNVVARAGKLKIDVKSVEYDVEAETVSLVFEKVLPKGKLEISLDFGGVILEGMRGLYRSTYKVGDEVRHLMTSQFEATDARRAFPCVDEPAAKAIFDVTLMVPKGHTAISNTLPTVVKEHESGYELVEFAPTPKMSTYLLAMIVGEFEFIETKTKEGVLVRVFTTPGKKHQAQFALDVASKTLSFFNDYFGIPYPLPVLDMIAIPDFESGAMENWGAVTYRETQVLVDEVHSSAITKQWVAITIAHELVHQWFGNLVTMEWWTHLWLNEGFATYIEYVAVDYLFPEWNIWNQFVSMTLTSALELDSLENTHPIEVEVHHPREIEEIFDMVSYAKGASVIRMLATYLGEKHFRAGLTRYLKKHSYQNAFTEDLWAAFEHVSKKPVRAIMAKWTQLPGYPLLTVHQSKKGIELEQTRFFANGSNRSQDSLWKIPVSFQIDGNKSEGLLMTTKRLKLGRGYEKSLLINPQTTGFYRVDYPAALLGRLAGLIAEGKLSTSQRYAILNDAFALTEAGKLSARETLILLDAFRGERDYVVWNAIASGVGTLNNLFYDQPFYEAFRVFARDLFTPIADLVGFEKQTHETHTDALLRGLVLHAAGTFGHEGVIKKAQQLFNQLVKGAVDLDPDIRAVVYHLAAKYGSEKQYGQLLKMYHSAHLHEEKTRIARSLFSFQSKVIVDKVLKFSLSKDVRIQDAPSLLARGLFTSHTKYETLKFVQQHWGELLKRYTGGHSLSILLSYMDAFTKETDAKHIEKFFKSNPLPGAARSLQQSLEKIRSNAVWLKRDGKVVAKWLKLRG